jgi:hypothetical protein
MVVMGVLIPTVRRAKLRHGRSYPIGAEAITAGLAGVPQFSQLSVEFECRAWREGEVAVVYTSRPGAWQITVGSVPAEHRAAISDALLSLGLPAVRRWLSAHRPEIWCARDHKLRLGCWGSAGNLSVREFERPSGHRHWPGVSVKPGEWLRYVAEPAATPNPTAACFRHQSRSRRDR